MKAVDFAVSRLLPPDLRQPQYDLSKKGVGVIMAQVASRYPEKFAEVAKGLGDLGRNAAWDQGYTITPEDARPVIDTQKFYDQMDAELNHLRKEKLPPKEFDEARTAIHMKYSDMIEKATMGAAVKGNNAWAKAVTSGARGNAAHVKAILSTPGVYTDNKGVPVPLFVRHSFSTGVRPAEMLAGTYGARLSVTGAKKAVAAGGDLGKLLSQSASHYNVTERDCGVNNGIDLSPDDPSLSGRVLARAAGNLPAGTVIDRAALASIRKLDKPVIVRSALTCKAKHGLCAHCVGLGADGKFPRIGESIGITAGQSVSEPIVQGSLNCITLGTLVRMADYSLKKIEEIKVGEWVLGADVNGNTFPVTVTHTWDQGTQPVRRYTYRGAGTPDITVECTEAHPILQVVRGEVGVKEAGNNVSDAAALIGEELVPYDCISIVQTGDKHCWDLTVDHPDSLFLLHNHLVVHNTKHNSGMAKGRKAYSGFGYTSQFVQVPDDFKDRAAVAELPGEVDKVEEAPQGGTYIYVNGQRHFALPGMEILVKPGEKVEAGDQLSDGLVNPHDIVRLRGLGEGRRYYAERLGQILSDSGNPPDRRHMEVIAKATVDNYLTDDPDAHSDYQPDELVRENEFLKNYTPPADTTAVSLDKAHGHYLQQPVLHYTVGTQITPKMAERMKAAGAERVLASREAPWFKPEMKRLRVASHDSKDWMVGLGTSYLSTNMRKALERGDETNVRENYHFGPRLAFGGDAGSGGFGENIESTGKF